MPQAARASGQHPNPFPVYPVSSLRSIASDILEKTVRTDAVQAIDEVVGAYAAAAGERSGRVGRAVPIRGDFGTGKTHLLLFAQAHLRQVWPGGNDKVVVVSAAATEAEFGKWYVTVLGPILAKLDLGSIVLGLLAEAACEVAEKVQLTAGTAQQIRADPPEVYSILRKELISRTDVERALQRQIEAITPRGSAELRAALAALAWPERQEVATRWLVGNPLKPPERELLTVARDLDPEVDPASVLVAMAGACARGGRAFALHVDEFEHLMANDRRTGTRRNATEVKRLLEGLQAMGALVLVAGHWSGWDQLPDFRDRFAGQEPVDLVALTAMEIGQVVATAAPEWRERLSEADLEAVAEAGGGNIRRVLTVLHHLHADTAEGKGPIDAMAVRRVVQRRLRSEAEPARTPAEVLQEAVRVAGGTATQDETLFGRLRFDIVVRRGEDIRLVADLRHAPTDEALAQLLEEFSILVAGLQRRHKAVRGLLLVTGAVNLAALRLLDPVPGVEALDAEGLEVEAAIRRAVATALSDASVVPAAPQPGSAAPEAAEARERIRELRADYGRETEATRTRLKQLDFGDSERDAAATDIARSAWGQPVTSALGPGAEVLDSFSESMRALAPTPQTFLFLGPNFALALAAILSPFIFWILSNIVADSYYSVYGWQLLRIIMIFMPVAIGLVLLQRYVAERRAFLRYVRWGRDVLEETIILNAYPIDLMRLKNQLVDEPDKSGSFRHAIERLAPTLKRLPE